MPSTISAVQQTQQNTQPLVRGNHSSINQHISQLEPMSSSTSSIFSRVLSPNTKPERTSPKLRDLEDKCNKIRELKEALDRGDNVLAHKKFSELPSDSKGFLHWAVWFKDWLANRNSHLMSDPNYGTNQIKGNRLLTLRESTDKVIYLRGGHLVEQLLFSVEEQLSVQKQTENVKILDEIDGLIRQGRDKNTILTKFEELPLQLQWKIHEEIQDAAAGGKNLGYEWGKNKLYAQPAAVLRELKPGSHHTWLQHYTQAQKELLDLCDLTKDRIELAKMDLLFPQATQQAQKEELKKWLAPRVREWVCSAEAARAQEAVKPQGECYGAHYKNGLTTFRLSSQDAREVTVVLTAYGREECRLSMKQNSNGEWETITAEAKPGRTYFYLIKDRKGVETKYNIDHFGFGKVYVPEVNEHQSVVVNSEKPQGTAVTLNSSLPQGNHAKLYESRGAHYKNGSTTFRVYAPQAQEVSVLLTAWGNQQHRLKMQKNAKGEWEMTTPLAQPGRTYLYLVKDCNGKEMSRTDPFSFSTVSVPEVGQVHSVVVDTAKYRWNDHGWMAHRAKTDPLKAPLAIYELQLKSWKSGTEKPLNFREMAPQLIDYCKRMGFTHVEVFGLLEHLHKDARGYQVANFFAPYRECGGSDDFKYLVDQLHQKGIGVIVDWIPTHFQDYHQSPSFSVSMHEFDGTNMFAGEGSPWGTRYLDYSKEETRRLMFASAMYYLDKLHVDGIRFDAISQLVHRNGRDIPAGLSFLKELNDSIRTNYPGVMTIAEETEGFPNVTKPTKEGGLGFDMKWNIGWSHDTRNLLRTPYHERPHHWQHKVMNFLNGVQHGEKVILTHSHDDTDSGENDNSKTLMQCVAHGRQEAEKFADLRNFFSWQTLAPSWGHMVHMGDEFGQRESWYQRFRKNAPSVDWSLEHHRGHNGVQQCVADLNILYRSRPELWAKPDSSFELIADHPSNAVVAYHRGMKDGKRVAVVHNFSNKGYDSYDIPLPSSSTLSKCIQKASELFSSDHLKYGGSGRFENRNVTVIRNPRGEATHLRMALPPLSTVVLEEQLH